MRQQLIKLLFLLIGISSFMNATIYSNGDSSQWSIYDNTPAGATISNTTDSTQGNVISLNGSGTDNGYILGAISNNLVDAWNNNNEFTLKWKMKYDETFLIFVSIETTQGHKYLTYSPHNYNAGSGHGLGTDVIDGIWKNFSRDLVSDLHDIDSTNELLEVNGFLIRGSGLIDDIELVNSTATQKADKLNKIKTLINAALDGTKEPIYMIAGDSHRDASYALSQVIYHRELNKFNIDYWHTAQTGITSSVWMDGSENNSTPPLKIKYAIFKSKVRGFQGEDTILEFELGNNDWKRLERNMTTQQKEEKLIMDLEKDINEILTYYPKLNIFLVASTKHNRSISESLQRVYQKISDDLKLPLMIEPTDDIYFTEYGYGTNIDEIQFSADGAHPTYLGALKVLYGTLKYITDSTRSDVQSKLTWTASLYGDTSGHSENLAEGVEVQNKLRIFDDHYTTQEESGFSRRGMLVPVIGGSIIKVTHPGKKKSIKLMIGEDESYLHGLGFPYDEIGTTASTVSLKKGVRKNTNPYKTTDVHYNFIYIPIGCTHIYINISLNELDIDANLTANPVEVYYATSAEMSDWHPDIDQVTPLSDRLFK